MGVNLNSARGRGRRRQPMADINVTPMVDVMLVLLVVFMITAPMLTTGVAVDLPKTKAQQLPVSQTQPLVVTINKTGQVFVGTQDKSVDFATLGPMLKEIVGNDLEKRVFVRADENAPYGSVAKVLALMQSVGIKNTALPVDPNLAVRALEEGKKP